MKNGKKVQSDFARNTLPVIVGMIAAVIVFINYFVSNPIINETTALLRNNVTLISAFALVLGAANLLQVNYRYWATKREGLWWAGPIYLILFPILGIAGIMNNPLYNFIYTNIGLPAEVAITSFVGFFIIQGMYRALKIRNIESLLITLSTFLIILGRIPVGGIIWGGFAPIHDWLLLVTGTAGVRALLIVYGFGIVSMGVRAVLGYERTQIGILEGGEE